MLTFNQVKQLISSKQTGALFPDKKEAKHGFTHIGNSLVFYKDLPEKSYFEELKGYKIVKRYYPTCKLVKKTLSNGRGVLFFEIEQSVGKNRGLLADYIGRNIYIEKWKELAIIYKKTFLMTLKKIDKSADEIFFRDRIKSRLEKYYSQDFWLSFEEKSIEFNGRRITLYPNKIIEDLKEYFKKPKYIWGVISQGDPLDLNIGIKPIFFDYQTSGYNYLMSESSNLFWSNLALGDLFSIKYYAKAYENHKKCLSEINEPLLSRNSLIYQPTRFRKIILKIYSNEVLSPCIKIISKKEKYNWYYDFKHFIAMRILCTFDLNKMKYKDQLLSLAYLQIFFNITPETFDKLIEIIWE